MEVRAVDNGQRVLDTTLTWIDKILGRLRLLVHDYPGLNNLKLELKHLQMILPCAGYSSTAQHSILSPFSLKLQNFFFILRSEDRLVSALAEEISRFHESVKSILEQICEWSTIMFDSILDKLQPLLLNHPGDDHGLSRLKVELKLVKVFCQCLINSREQRSTKSFISEVKCPIYEKASQFYYHLLRLEEASLNLELPEAFSSFQESLKSYKQQICEFYTRMLGGLDDFSPWPICELVEFFDSLLESLADIIIWGETCDPAETCEHENLIEPLQEKLIFLKNFVRFATLGVENNLEVENNLGLRNFFIHCQDSAVKAALLCYICWFYRDVDQVYNDLQSRSSKPIKEIKPVNSQVYQNYIETLKTSRNSISTFLFMEVQDAHIVGNFIDSLLDKLLEFLDLDTNFVVCMELQMQILAEGLKFLRTFLKQQQEKFYGLQQDMKNRIIDVVYMAADIIFQLHMLRREECLAKTMDLQIFHLMEEMDSIKAEVAKEFPVLSTFPTTNELEFIDLILQNLKELGSCELDSISSVDCRIQQVQKDLENLRSFLENIQEHHKHDKMLHALWRRAVELAYKAEFVIDSLRARGISAFSLMLFDAIAKEIVLFTGTLEIDHKNYAFQARNAAKIMSHVPSQGSSATNDVVVGFDGEAKAIIDQLVTRSKELDIIFIEGMPGVGKTTLAKQVFQDSSVTSHFHVRAWGYVSQLCCRKDVVLEILRCIVPEHSNDDNNENEDDLIVKLYRHLIGKRYLIVLDDIWDIETWNVLERLFPRKDLGSRILLTGRSYFSIEPTAKPYPLRRLTDDECWELLQKKLACKEDLSPFLREIGWRIAKSCKGLPLTVVIIAGILANLELVAWEKVATSLSSNVVCGTEEGKSILELSYRHLPDYLKPGLLYIAAFPEGQEISMQRLMWLWIAEGFVKRNVLNGLEDIAERNQVKELEDIAEENIMALINRNLIMVSKRGSMGKVKTCQIHDLIREFCLVKSKEENFLQMIKGQDDLFRFDEPPNLRRLCIFSQPKHFDKSGLFCPRIRSLLFYSQGVGSRATCYTLSFVFRIKLLGILDLAQINLGFVFPDAIAMLILLRYLAILGGMKGMPSSIAKLSNLETLLVTINHKRLGGFSLPDTLWDLQQLRHLHVRGCLVDLSFVNDDLGSSSSLKNLVTFSTPKLDLGRTVEKIMKFPNIRKLKCSLFHSPRSTGERDQIVEIQFPSRLEMLKLFLCNVNLPLVNFNFPSNLKKLTLVDFSCGMISTVSKLSNLEVLKLLNGSIDGIEKWRMKEEEFPNLKFLKLGNSNIVKWKSSGDHHFPSLRILVLEGCRELEKLPSCLETITTLDLIKVHRCPEVVGRLVGEIKEELKSWGNEGVKILISEEYEKD